MRIDIIGDDVSCGLDDKRVQKTHRLGTFEGKRGAIKGVIVGGVDSF